MNFKNLYVGEDENTIVLKNYDTNNNGKVDVAEVAESVDWDGIQNKPPMLDGEVYTTTEKNKLASLENYVKPTSEPISYIQGLQTALDNLGASNITNLQADIDNILTLLASDDLSLDTLQEIVDFITLNKDTLDNLGINNIAGLQTALDGKAPIIHNHDTTYEPKNTNIQEHVNSISNPHAVTKIQIGLNNVPNLDTTNAVANEHTHTNKSILDAITSSFTTTLKTAYDTASSWVTTNGNNLINHLSNISNPHSVTKSQVGLGNVDNTSDINKPISDATATALNNKVDKVVDKGLSSNDYTTTEKNKLASLENYVKPTSEPISYIQGLIDALNGKSSNTHTHNLNDLTEKSYNSLTDKPTQKQQIYFKRYLPLEGATTATGYGLALSYSGTSTAKTPAGTNGYTRMPNTIEFLQTTASATTVASVWGTVATGVFLGDGQETKFTVVAGVATGASNASHRFALGITSALVTTDVDPSTQIDCILLGYDKTDTNIQIMHNNDSGICNKIDTGWAKPSVDRTGMYTFQVWTEDQGTTWNYKAQNQTTNETLTGTITTDIPTATRQFIAGAYIGAGAVSAVKGVCIGSIGIDGYIL